MNPRASEAVHENSDLSQDSDDPVTVLGCCFGLIMIPASEVQEFYRGYAFAGLITGVTAVLAGVVSFTT